MTLANFDWISLVYGVAALFIAVELVRNRRDFVDTLFTADDRALAVRVGFLWLTPFGVLIHEVAHWLLAQSVGASNVRMDYRFYWGFVSYRGLLPAEASFAIAAAGPLASALLAVAALVAALRAPQPFRTVLGVFGITTAGFVLVIYPIMSFIGPVGDFRIIYADRTPSLGAAAGVFHMALLAMSAWLYYRRGPMTPVRPSWGWQPAAPAPNPLPLETPPDQPTRPTQDPP
ncbi:MAG: hypothetical protein EXR52_00680 [Dehalococcoidia bacterium]|nr:hypothetical protein [Dehalococcoidia bacterium]